MLNVCLNPIFARPASREYWFSDRSAGRYTCRARYAAPIRFSVFYFHPHRLSALLTTRLPPTAAQAVLPAARKRVFRLSDVLLPERPMPGETGATVRPTRSGFLFPTTPVRACRLFAVRPTVFSPALSPLWPIRCLRRPCVPVLLPVRKPACFLLAFTWHEAPKKYRQP